MISLLGIVIGLALFILLAYMGYNTIIVAIASASSSIWRNESIRSIN